jgi:predicted dehydrogenase
MTRVDRRDPDFSTTAIHGIDAVRFLAGGDYAEARFRYAELPELGRGVANIFVDAVMTTGATAHLAFCPVAGAVVERATVHAKEHSLFVQIPMWGGPDSPGRLDHFERGRVVADIAGDPDEGFVVGGFYGEYEAFLGDLAAGRSPSPSLGESRQSVAVAECIARREGEYHA